MELDKNNELKYRADFILNYYFLGHSRSFDERIQEWLSEGTLTEAKDDALREIWDTRVKWDEPDEFAYRSLDVLRVRLGFAAAKGKLRLRKFLRISAAAVVLAILSVIILKMTDVLTLADDKRKTAIAGEMTYTTVEVGGIARKHVVLPDGSEVWLGSYSKIVYPDRFETERNVQLTGNAYFSVMSKDSMPFCVMGKNLKIKVLGTEFEVRVPEEGEKAEVMLVRGSVEVELRDDTQKVLMKPNEKLSYDVSTGGVVIGEMAENSVAAWREVRLDFDDTPLQEALRMIGIYYGVTLQVEGTAPLNGKITGKFDEDELLEEVLFIVGKVSCMFDYEIEGECVRLIWR